MESENYNHVIFYDGVCGLCNKLVQFILLNERGEKLFFCALQTDLAKELLGEQRVQRMDTLYFLSEGVVYEKSTAALRVSGFLKQPWRLLAIFWIVPKPLRDWVYQKLANSRYAWFGKSDACMLPPPNAKKRFLNP